MGALRGLVGLITLADGRVYAAAVFLAGATLELAAGEALIADVGRAMIRGMG